MALFEWSEELSVGVSEMDLHHRKLFDIMNSLHEATQNDNADTAVLPIIEKMLSYTKYHFDKEEQLMTTANYTGLPAQKAAHQAFIAKLEEFKAQASMEKMAIFVVTKLNTTGGEWLKQHIKVMDKQYVKFMHDAGIN